MKKLILFMTIFASMISFSSCGNKQDSSTQEQTEYYAVNDVKNRDRTGQIEEQHTDSVATSSEAESEDPFANMTYEEIKKYYDIEDHTFNVVKDVNADKVTDMNTISIDGKLISFPVDYKTLKDKFELYTEAYQKYTYTEPVDEKSTQTLMEVHAKPTTGTGIIIFVFTSDEPKTISEMTCKQVILTGSATDNSQLMTIALPYGITFGCSYEDVQTDKDTQHYETTESENWKYTIKDDSYSVSYSGISNKLYSVNITYK